MTRLLAAAALAWINFTLLFLAISPAFGAGPASNLPMCCRRDGKHACSLPTPSPVPGPAFQAARCPMYPGARAVPAQAKASGRTPFVTVRAAIASYSAAEPQTQARYRMSYSRAEQKRGPPVFLT